MEEIKIGEYIRTKKGTIVRIKDTEFDICFNLAGQVLYKKWICGECFYEEIAKHSKNIKELVQAGDFINGMQVDEFDDEEGTVLGIPVYEDGLFNTLNFYVPIESINIKTILTKEKFENECFRLKEGQDV